MPGRLFICLRSITRTVLCATLCMVSAPPSALAACPADGPAAGKSLAVTRTIEIDASAGPIFGSLTSQAREPSFLKPKEVVLTFDDGPMPWVTKSILDTLDRYCTKATFFSVGRMALAYPATVRDVLARGHTLGTHTYSHPFNMPRMKLDTATAEIERGFAAVATAAGGRIAPFFRFTGLADSARLLGYMQTRGIASFTVDAVSNDSYIADPGKLADRTMAEITRTQGGIVLFHDIKPATAKALPVILERLAAQGYSVVHITAKAPAAPLTAMMQDVAPKMAQVRNGESGGKTLLPFYGAIAPDVVQREGAPHTTGGGQLGGVTAAAGTAPVTALAPAPRARDVARVAASPTQTARNTTASTVAPASIPGSGWLKTSIQETSDQESGAPPVYAKAEATTPSGAGGWVTQVKPGALKRISKPGP